MILVLSYLKHQKHLKSVLAGKSKWKPDLIHTSISFKIHDIKLNIKFILFLLCALKKLSLRTRLMVQGWLYSLGKRRYSSLHKGLEQLNGTLELVRVVTTLISLLSDLNVFNTWGSVCTNVLKTHNYSAGHGHNCRGKGERRENVSPPPHKYNRNLVAIHAHAGSLNFDNYLLGITIT